MAAPAPWTFVKRYHCIDCAAADENYWWEILDANAKEIRGLTRIHDEALATLIVNAVNAVPFTQTWADITAEKWREVYGQAGRTKNSLTAGNR